tara:strand:- start:124 stop:468 length:345 start_codon:yes stop_codon:yes gene_type:complete
MIIYILILFLFLGCSQKEFDEGFYHNGLLKWEKNIHSGKWIRYFENGKVRWESNYIKGLDGLYCATYYVNGQIHKEEFFIDGVREGDCISYFRDGRIQKIESYEDGHLINSVYY